MLRTVLACLALAWAAYASAAWLTHDFQAWTAEGARRLEVALAPVPAPTVPVDGPDIATTTLPALLAQGGEVTMVEFVYTHCETICLVLGNTFQQMQAALQQQAAHGAAPSVRLLSISFDPRRDTPAQLATYAQRMKADPRWWRFVRVPDAAATQRLLAAFQVVVVPDGRGDFEHNAALLVVGRDGRLLRIFDIAEQQLALDYALHLAQGGSL